MLQPAVIPASPIERAAMTPAEWFKARLKALRLTQNDAAKAIGKNPSQITRLLRGEREPRPAELRALAVFLRVTVAELVTRLGIAAPDDVAPLDGVIGAGGVVAAAAPEDMIDLTGLRGRKGFERVEAYRIAPDAAIPQYDAGDVLFFIPPRDGRLEHAAGHECIVTLASGQKLFRRVRPGSRPGLFHLLSRGGDELTTDAEIVAAVVLDLIDPA